jgi:hypothetical protein
MKTRTGRELAARRQKTMQMFVDDFMQEWDGRV